MEKKHECYTKEQIVEVLKSDNQEERRNVYETFAYCEACRGIYIEIKNEERDM